MPNRNIHQRSLHDLRNPSLHHLFHHLPQSAELPPSRLNHQDFVSLFKVQVSRRLRHVVRLRVLLRTNVHYCLSNCYRDRDYLFGLYQANVLELVDGEFGLWMSCNGGYGYDGVSVRGGLSKGVWN